MEAYLRPSGKSNPIVSEIFNISEKVFSVVSVFNTETADKFQKVYIFMTVVNLIGTLNFENKASHDIQLNYHSKPIRGKSKEVIIELQEKPPKLKETVEQSMISSLQHQHSETSWDWNWSGL